MRKLTSSAGASALLEAWTHTLARWVPGLPGLTLSEWLHMCTSSHSTTTAACSSGGQGQTRSVTHSGGGETLTQKQTWHVTSDGHMYHGENRPAPGIGVVGTLCEMGTREGLSMLGEAWDPPSQSPSSIAPHLQKAPTLAGPDGAPALRQTPPGLPPSEASTLVPVPALLYPSRRLPGARAPPARAGLC